MQIERLGLKELLFLFMNVKGKKFQNGQENNTNNAGKTCKSSDEIPGRFDADTTIKSSKNKKTSLKTPQVDDADKMFEDFRDHLNDYYDFQDIKFQKPENKKMVVLSFLNPDHRSLEELLDKIFRNISIKMMLVKFPEFSKEFAMATFGYRGSFDLSHNYYTVDLHGSHVNVKNFGEIIKLLNNSELNSQFNFNFRELQKEGTARATQIRINLRYFYDNYVDELSHINPFRYQQFQLNKPILLRKSINRGAKSQESFIERVHFYMNNVVSRDSPLDKLDIKSLRKKLNFHDDDDKKQGPKKEKRSNNARASADLLRPEECAGCHNIYPTEARTFKKRGKDVWYFELHHVISYANNNNLGIETENDSNYVKLCPTCHRALTHNSAEPECQRRIIDNILDDGDDTLQFVKDVQYNFDNHQAPDEFVLEHLT